MDLFSLTLAVLLVTAVVRSGNCQSLSDSEGVETEAPVTLAIKPTTPTPSNSTDFESLFGQREKVNGVRLCQGDTWFQAVVKPFVKSPASTRYLKTTREPSAEQCAQICYSLLNCTHATFLPTGKAQNGDCSLFNDVKVPKCLENLPLVKSVTPVDEIKLACLECRDKVSKTDSGTSPFTDLAEVTRACGSNVYFRADISNGQKNFNQTDKLRTVAVSDPSQCASVCYGVPLCRLAIYTPSQDPNSRNVGKCHLHSTDPGDKQCAKGVKLTTSGSQTDRLLLSCFSCQGKV